MHVDTFYLLEDICMGVLLLGELVGFGGDWIKKCEQTEQHLQIPLNTKQILKQITINHMP